MHYALILSNDNVLLRQREKSASLMPGMWELPSLDAGARLRRAPILTLRHSITTTDYVVRVFAGRKSARMQGRWARLDRAERLPLTGLTGKILRGLAAVQSDHYS